MAQAAIQAAQVTYTVKGHWPFPADMLRHDASCAASDGDQAVIDALSQDHAPDRTSFIDVEIALVGPYKPNTARWESFGWAVPGDETNAFYKRMREADQRKQALIDSALRKLTAEERAVICDAINAALAA
ncbi:MAG: CcrRogue [Marmoricola sp.]|nr:CcrRogue [Marmoricola sp.]